MVTSSAGLQSTYVIHVLFQDSLAGWRNKMVTCLEEADKKLIKSVAFPVLGSGENFTHILHHTMSGEVIISTQEIDLI